MFLTLEERLRDAVAAHVKSRYDVDIPIVVESPKRSSFGELALPVSMALAKSLKRPPRQIAEEIVAELPPIEGVARLEIAGAGFINVRFDALAERAQHPDERIAQHSVAQVPDMRRLVGVDVGVLDDDPLRALVSRLGAGA